MRHYWILTIAALGCSHSEPLPSQDYGTDRPFLPGPPAQLTANPGDDGEISFTPDGAELVYTISGSCLGFLPAHQARDREWLCAPPDTGEISNRYQHAAISPGRRLAWVLTRSRPFESGPFYRAVLVAPLADLRDSSEVTPVPFRSVVDGILHPDISRLVWLRGDTLAILADSIVYLTDPRDTVQPRVYLPLPLPGKAYSIQPGKNGSVLYLRLAGDSRVLAWDLASRSLSQVCQLATTANGAVAVGSRHLASAIPGAVLRIDLAGSRVDTIPTVKLVVAELAISPDGSDLIASAVDTSRLPPGPVPPGPMRTDLFRLKK